MKTTHDIIQTIVERVVVADVDKNVDALKHLAIEFDVYYNTSEDKQEILRNVHEVIGLSNDTAILDFFFGSVL